MLSWQRLLVKEYAQVAHPRVGGLQLAQDASMQEDPSFCQAGQPTELSVLTWGAVATSRIQWQALAD